MVRTDGELQAETSPTSEAGVLESRSERSGLDGSERVWTRRGLLGEGLRRGTALGAGITMPGVGSALLSDDRPVLWDGPAATPGIRKRTVLGRTGIEIPDISFGTFSLEDDEQLVRHALDRGITHFDTAENYTGGAPRACWAARCAVAGTRSP